VGVRRGNVEDLGVLRPLDAIFTGAFDDDGEGFRGGWRPNPGADETINVPYDIGGRRVA